MASGVTTRSTYLSGVSAISAGDVWSVGYTAVGTNTTALIEHWNGSAWSVISGPDNGNSLLNGVTARASNDVWAVGATVTSSGNQPLIEYWDGSQWSLVPSAGQGTLQSVAAISANDVWAVGTNGPGTLTMHWDGQSWTTVPSPSPSYGSGLSGVSGVASNDVWAVGMWHNGQYTDTLIMHWNGTQWTIVTSPSPSTFDDYLGSVSAIAADNAWAVGSFIQNTFTVPLMLHWDGTSWRAVNNFALPSSRAVLNSVIVTGASSAWAVGLYLDTSMPTAITRTLTLSWDGSYWSPVASVDPGTGYSAFNGLAATGTSDLWGVGSFHNPEGSTEQPLIEHFSNECTSLPTPTSTATATATGTPTSTATSAALLTGHVTWQGPPAQPNSRQQLPITLTLKLGTTETNYPVQNTDASGNFTVTIGALPSGTYEWRAKGARFLASSGQVTLSGQAVTSVEMGIMRAGDANNDNVVSTQDFNILKASLGKGCGDPGYDTRADFNNDCLISTTDFTLLKANLGLGGSPPLSARESRFRRISKLPTTHAVGPQ